MKGRRAGRGKKVGERDGRVIDVEVRIMKMYLGGTWPKGILGKLGRLKCGFWTQVQLLQVTKPKQIKKMGRGERERGEGGWGGWRMGVGEWVQLFWLTWVEFRITKMYLGATWSKGITTKPKIQFKPSRGNRTMQVLATFLDQRKLAY